MFKILTLKRSRRGSNIIELASTCLVLTVATILSVDVGTIIFGTIVHNRVCREAARAASVANSQKRAVAIARATLAACQSDGNFLSPITFTDPELQYQDFGGTPKPDEVPIVTLTTHCKIRLPAGVSFCSAVFGATGDQLPSACNYTFPITNYQVPVPASGP